MRAKLLVNVTDAELSASLEALDVLSSFTKVYASADDANYLHTLDETIDVAVIEVTDRNRPYLSKLRETPYFDDIEFVFISDGKPDKDLDELIYKGAGFHFRKPFDLAQISQTLEDFQSSIKERSSKALPANTSSLDQFGLLVGSSRAMHKLYRLIRKVSASDVNVLIIGESGCGKELVANTIHLSSERSDEPFVAINCGALSPELVDSELFGHVKGAFTGAHRDHDGVFTQAEGGTLFLDEVTEMPVEHQIKLLRVLETGEYRPVGSNKTLIANVRVVAATNRDPKEAIAENVFRHDLYFRLAQFPVHVPPLRKRGKDIKGLAKHFLAYRNAEEGTNVKIDSEALEKIRAHQWPGNVRELKYAIERAFLLADDIIMPSDLVLENMAKEEEKPAEQEEQIPSGIPLLDLERQVILKTLEDNKGNKTDTANQLGISVKTLYNKLEKYQQDMENHS